MFGYVRISKGELKVKDYEMYKAVYCTLCKTLGKHYGFLSRLTLSYDFTFLSLLNMSVNDECIPIERKRCAFNPLKKCNYCKKSAGTEMPAGVAMIMLYYKLLDNIQDEKGFKGLGYRLIKPLFSSAFKKASRVYPQIAEIVKDYIIEQSRLEGEECSEIDEICHPTANALAEIFALCSEKESDKRILSRLGYCMGRYIYLLDACVDFTEDLEHNKYNVLKFSCKTKEQAIERVKPQLYFSINESAKAFELLDLKRNKDILGNIIYLGLEDTFKKELEI